MFICTYDLKTMKNLKRINARLMQTIKMQDKEMYVFAFNQDIYNLYNSKFDGKNIFLNNKLYFV